MPRVVRLPPLIGTAGELLSIAIIDQQEQSQHFRHTLLWLSRNGDTWTSADS